MAFSARERGQSAHAADGARGEVGAAAAYRRYEQLYGGIVRPLEEYPFREVYFTRHPDLYGRFPFAFKRGGGKQRDAVRFREGPEDARAGGQRPRI